MLIEDEEDYEKEEGWLAECQDSFMETETKAKQFIDKSKENTSKADEDEESGGSSVISIDVGTARGGGHWGHVPPRFCNKQRTALFTLKNAPFFLRKKCPRSVVLPKFEMLPTSLAISGNSREEETLSENPEQSNGISNMQSSTQEGAASWGGG